MNIIEANDIRQDDKVQLKPLKLLGQGGNLSTDVRESIIKNGYVWKFVHINSQGEVTLNYDDIYLLIPESFLLGHAFKRGDKIEISHTGDSWELAYFEAYLPSAKLYLVWYMPGMQDAGTHPCPVKYARPVRKPELIPLWI